MQRLNRAVLDARLPAGLKEAMEELAALHEKQAATMRELYRALVLRAWIPESAGGARLSFRGPTTAPLRTWRCDVHLKSGETLEFPILEVPVELLPDEITNSRQYKLATTKT